MKPAHQGVPVAGLPGLSAGRRPRACCRSLGCVHAGAGRPAPRRRSRPGARPSGGIDTWLIDRLFGRR